MHKYGMCWKYAFFGALIVGLFLVHAPMASAESAQNSKRNIHINLMNEETEKSQFDLQVIDVLSQRKTIRRVYLYHTHTYEAYDMRDGNRYQPTETWRTADEEYNMIRIGKALKDGLEKAGIQVTHDTTHYEIPRLTTAYSRSLEGLRAAEKMGYDLYIDLHRDAYSENNGPNTISMGEKKLGRFLFLIGQGTGTELDDKPDWEKNQKAAQWISDALNEQLPGLSRGVSLKSGRYNQQAACPSMLIEAGNNQNTLTEILSSIPLLVNAICSYFDRTE